MALPGGTCPFRRDAVAYTAHTEARRVGTPNAHSAWRGNFRCDHLLSVASCFSSSNSCSSFHCHEKKCLLDFSTNLVVQSNLLSLFCEMLKLSLRRNEKRTPACLWLCANCRENGTCQDWAAAIQVPGPISAPRTLTAVLLWLKSSWCGTPETRVLCISVVKDLQSVQHLAMTTCESLVSRALGPTCWPFFQTRKRSPLVRTIAAAAREHFQSPWAMVSSWTPACHQPPQGLYITQKEEKRDKPLTSVHKTAAGSHLPVKKTCNHHTF